ncbi:MAG: hypothetical protein ACREO3_06895 [Arenimonas sp.]
MLALDSPRWSELPHAYGRAGDIPALLRELATLPASENPDDEPWQSLWSALAHQGDVYPASFAAVPHVVHALESDPSRASSSYLQFPAWVEICRRNRSVSVQEDLRVAYEAALAKLPLLAARSLEGRDDPNLLQCACAATAAALGQAKMAEAMLELSPGVAAQFLEWFYGQ